MKEIVFATTNYGKLKEVREALPGIKVLSLNDFEGVEDVEETEDSYLGNALLKAKHFHKVLGLPILVEDSGLNVPILSTKKLGWPWVSESVQVPGIYSARYSMLRTNNSVLNHDNDANNTMLLFDLLGISDREASMESHFVYVDEDGQWTEYVGIMEGFIDTKSTGTNGFAYDYVFIPNGYKVSYASLETEEKNLISHRVKALNKVIKDLEKRALDKAVKELKSKGIFNNEIL